MAIRTRLLRLDTLGRVWYQPPPPSSGTDNGDDVDDPEPVDLGPIDRLDPDAAPRGLESELEELIDLWKHADDPRDLDREANDWYNATRGIV